MSNIAIKHEYLLRIASYSSSHYPQESITEEMFIETYGGAFGSHYYSKWRHAFKYDILKMVFYFGRDTTEGRKFCGLLAKMIEKYETRVGK